MLKVIENIQNVILLLINFIFRAQIRMRSNKRLFITQFPPNCPLALFTRFKYSLIVPTHITRPNRNEQIFTLKNNLSNVKDTICFK